MARGKKCPYCGEPTFLQKDNVATCSDCGFIGWRITDKVKNVKGKGLRCPNCGKPKLHWVYQMFNQIYVYRCTVCAYCGIGGDGMITKKEI